MFVKLTSGANAGAMAVILKATVLGSARVGEFMQVTPTNPAPTIGLTVVGTETYSIVSPALLPQVTAFVDGPAYFSNATGGQFGSLYMQDCQPGGFNSTFAGSGTIALVTCQMLSVNYTIQGAFDQNNVYSNAAAAGISATAVSFYSIYGGGSPFTSGGHPFTFIDTSAEIDANFVLDGGAIQVQTGADLTVYSLGAFDGSSSNPRLETFAGSLLYFDNASPAGATPALWGSQANASLQMHTGAFAQFDSTFTFPIAGAGGGTFTMGGNTTATSFRSDTGAFIGARNLTYALLKTNYAGNGWNNHCVDMLTTGCAFVQFG
jgi:hypothetical protein